MRAPVCPTWSEWGRQPRLVTTREPLDAVGGQAGRGPGDGERGDDVTAGVADRRGHSGEAELELIHRRPVAAVTDVRELALEHADEQLRRSIDRLGAGLARHLT